MQSEHYSDLSDNFEPDSSYIENGGQSIISRIKDSKYLTFLFVGIGLLWPWNCILGASQYFKHDMFSDDTIWSKIFASSMMTVSTVSSTLFNFWLAGRQYGYSERVIRGLLWEIIVFVLLGILTLLKSSFVHSFLFTSIMVLVAISSMATAMTQNGIMAAANVYGAEFSQAVMVGQAIAGVLPSIVLFTISLFGDPSRQSTGGILFYFLITAAVSTVCIILYRTNRIGAKLINVTSRNHTATQAVPFNVLYNKLKYLVLSIFTTFTVTLIFPVFASTTLVKGLPLSDSQFIPFIFTVWNLGDLYGRVVADWPQFRSPEFSPFKIFIYSLLRVLFVPLFFFFSMINSEEHTSSPILKDLFYTLLQFLFGLTNGHVISVSFMKVPGALPFDDEKEAAGGFTNIFVSAGLTLGSILSYGCVLIIELYSKEK